MVNDYGVGDVVYGRPVTAAGGRWSSDLGPFRLAVSSCKQLRSVSPPIRGGFWRRWALDWYLCDKTLKESNQQSAIIIASNVTCFVGFPLDSALAQSISTSPPALAHPKQTHFQPKSHQKANIWRGYQRERPEIHVQPHIFPKEAYLARESNIFLHFRVFFS